MIIAKLPSILAEIPTLTNDSQNTHFGNRYLSLKKLIAILRPVLDHHHIVLIQPCEGDRVTTKLIDLDDGDTLESAIDLPMITDPQKVAGAVTYYRRYTLTSLLGLTIDDDDDGNTSTGRTSPKPSAHRPQGKPRPTQPQQPTHGQITREEWQRRYGNQTGRSRSTEPANPNPVRPSPKPERNAGHDYRHDPSWDV